MLQIGDSRFRIQIGRFGIRSGRSREHHSGCGWKDDGGGRIIFFQKVAFCLAKTLGAVPDLNLMAYQIEIFRVFKKTTHFFTNQV